MASNFSDNAENGILLLIFNKTTWAAIDAIDNGATVPNLYLSLHSADPVESGAQNANEVTTGQATEYARLSMARTSGVWNVAALSTYYRVKNVSQVTWTPITGGTGTTATHIGIGPGASGATVLMISGTLTQNLVLGVGVTPTIAANALTFDLY